MSFIRMGQDGGEYVDIPCGSQYYIYGNGEDISGWTDAEFAALIGSVVYETDAPESVQREIREGFEEHFGGWDEDYSGGIAAPERAYIFCQCVDRRIDNLELTDTLLERVRFWASKNPNTSTCDNCGDRVRPIRDTGKDFCNDKDECQEAFNEYLIDTAHENLDEEQAQTVEEFIREDIEKLK